MHILHVFNSKALHNTIDNRKSSVYHGLQKIPQLSWLSMCCYIESNHANSPLARFAEMVLMPNTNSKDSQSSIHTATKNFFSLSCELPARLSET